MTKKKSLTLICIATLLMIAILFAVSYAYWSKTKIQTGQNDITPGCLDFTMYNEKNEIDLEDVVPISDDEGRQLIPFTFSVKNTCTLTMEYRVNLEILDDTDLSLGFVDAVLDENDVELLSNLDNADPTITGAVSKTLGTAKLNPDRKRTHDVRIWLDKNVTALDYAQNKTFKAKVVVVGEPTDPFVQKCLRAPEDSLHTEVCKQTDTNSYCSSTNGEFGGTDITYGSTITYGSAELVPRKLSVGDAFDCDLNGDGNFNERFYYVSDLYTGTIGGVDQFNDEVAVLLYHSNVSIKNNAVSLNNSTGKAYNTANKNSFGPVTAIANLPSTDENQWSNMSLVSETRSIRDENGEVVTSYSYTGKAARLLTYQEIKNACPGNLLNPGVFDNPSCRFLIEKTKYASSSNLYGYWLETPDSSSESNVMHVLGNSRFVTTEFASKATYDGVRPAIEVPKEYMEI